MATDNGLYNTIITTHNGYYHRQLTLQIETLNLRLALYFLKQTVVILNTVHAV
jgi:hypothetical protein